ncbi:MAG: hypothetical protein ACRD98_11040 [Nitrososphaera sp.]
MRALVASVAIAIAIFAAMPAIYDGIMALDYYAAVQRAGERNPSLRETYLYHLTVTLVSLVVTLGSLVLGIYLLKTVLLRVAGRHVLPRLIGYLILLVVVLPNTLLALLIGLIGEFMQQHIPYGFELLVILSNYYIFPKSLFGKALFLTETVIAPAGVPGIAASAVFYAAVTLFVAFGVHFVASKFASRSFASGDSPPRSGGES